MIDEFRPHKEQDLEGVVQLFLKCFSNHDTNLFIQGLKKEDTQILERQFKDNKSKRIIGIKDGKIIAHIEGLIRRVTYNDDDYRVSQIVNWMVHPKYQIQGIGPDCFKFFENILIVDSVDMLLSFPNKPSEKVKRDKTKYVDIGKMPLIGKRIDKTYEVSNVYPVTEFDNGVERLFENVKGNLGLTTYRDSDYLNWRFTNNQLNQYEIYVLKSNPDSEKINGYVVLKTYDDGASKKGHIVDILADSKETLSNLLKYSENKFFQNGIQDISTYVMSSSGYFQDFLGNGYAPLTNDISILLKPLSDRFKSKLQADKDMSFHITMMDHDVF